MNKYIFDLNSNCENGQNFIIEVKDGIQLLEDDIIDLKNSDNLECERKSHHQESPFLLNKNKESHTIISSYSSICYRVNNSNWKTVNHNGTTVIIKI